MAILTILSWVVNKNDHVIHEFRLRWAFHDNQMSRYAAESELQSKKCSTEGEDWEDNTRTGLNICWINRGGINWVHLPNVGQEELQEVPTPAEGQRLAGGGTLETGGDCTGKAGEAGGWMLKWGGRNPYKCGMGHPSRGSAVMLSSGLRMPEKWPSHWHNAETKQVLMYLLTLGGLTHNNGPHSQNGLKDLPYFLPLPRSIYHK